MADEYVVRIVLDGIDNASDDVDRVEDKVGSLTSTVTEADSRMLMMAGSAAAVAGGLNQMTGGLRKAFEKVNKQVLKFEIVAGVAEFLASTFIVGAGASLLWSKRLGPFITKTGKAMRGVRGLGLAAGTLVGFMGSMVAIIGVLLFLFIAFDDEIKGVLMRMHKFGEETDFANRALTGLIDRVNGFKDAVGALGDDVFDNMNSKFRGQYAGGGRLA